MGAPGPALTGFWAHFLEVDMKKLALAAAMIVVGSAAFAGSYVEPVVEPEVIVAHSSSSAGGIVVPLLLLLLLVGVVAAR